MTNEKLLQHMRDFINSQSDVTDKWYGTTKALVGGVIEEFVEYLQNQNVRIDDV